MKIKLIKFLDKLFTKRSNFIMTLQYSEGNQNVINAQSGSFYHSIFDSDHKIFIDIKEWIVVQYKIPEKNHSVLFYKKFK